MKIFTITCHRPFNYGAVLQTYALNKYLRDIGHDAQVIDYIPSFYKSISEKYEKNIVAKVIRKVLLFPDMLKGDRVFGKFLADNIRLTERSYYSIRDMEDNLPLADIYIAGSDQIWNSDIPAGKDDAYFLTFVKKTGKKISYAASLAMDVLPPGQKKRYYDLLKDFKAISVRESSSVKLLNSAGLENVTNVLDPVFLLSKDEWVSFSEQSNEKERYILAYIFNGQENAFEYARFLAKQNNCKVCAVHTRWFEKFRRVDKYFWCPLPQKFLSLIYNAEAVVTNSFHGMSFSIIFNKNFFVFRKGKSGNSRMYDLLSYLGLTDRLIENTRKTFNQKDIDYEDVNTKVQAALEHSKRFLNDSLLIT